MDQEDKTEIVEAMEEALWSLGTMPHAAVMADELNSYSHEITRDAFPYGEHSLGGHGARAMMDCVANMMRTFERGEHEPEITFHDHYEGSVLAIETKIYVRKLRRFADLVEKGELNIGVIQEEGDVAISGPVVARWLRNVADLIDCFVTPRDLVPTT